MTTIELFHRLGRHARGGDFTRLGLTEQTDLLEAANAAIQQIYNLLPIYFKQMTEGFVLPAPTTISLALTNNSPTLPADYFTSDQFGRSILIDGDPAWNQIIGTRNLQTPYNGVTGTHSGTVYGNAVYSTRYPFDRIVGNPRFSQQNTGMFFRDGELTRAQPGTNAWLYNNNVGRPTIWWPEPLGNSQGNQPLLVLRFAPAPDIAYSINVRMAYWPRRLILDDAINASTITVPDQFIEPCLIPLGLRALMSTPVWESRKDEENIDKRADDAIEFLKNVPANQAPSNRIYTPIGF